MEKQKGVGYGYVVGNLCASPYRMYLWACLRDIERA